MCKISKVTLFNIVTLQFSYRGHVSTICLFCYWADDRGFESRQGLEIFLSTTVSRPVLGPNQPTIQWVAGALSLGVKRQGREAVHSPCSADVKNVWSYISTLPVRFHGSLLS